MNQLAQGRWDHRRYGSEEDPTHKSDLLEYSRCPRRFRFRKEDQYGAGRETRIFARQIAGTAVHGSLERALPWAIDQGKAPELHHLRQAYFESWYAALKKDGISEIELHWSKKDRPEPFHRRKIAELYHFLEAAPEHIAKVIAVEAQVVTMIGDFCMAGTIDIIFRTEEGQLAIADYKSGNRRPSRFRLNHGFEMGLYSHALRWGEVTLDNGETTKFGEYPKRIFLILTGDFLPQTRDSKRQIWMREECRHFRAAPGTTVQIRKGQRRGPGWYEAERSEVETAALARSVQQIIGSIRLGRFPPVLDDDCNHCMYRNACIAENYGPSAAERRQLDRALQALEPLGVIDPFDDFD